MIDVKNIFENAILEESSEESLGNLSSTDPGFMYKLQEIHKNTPYGKKIKFFVDGIECNGVKMARVPDLTISPSGLYVIVGWLSKATKGSLDIRLTHNGIKLV